MGRLVWSLAGLLLLVPAARADLGVDVGCSSTLSGQYVWRGQPLLGISLQSDAYLSVPLGRRLTATAYAWNCLLLDAGQGVAEQDWDLSLTWTPRWWGDRLSLTGGYIYYDVSNNPASPTWLGPDSQEVYLGVDLDLPGSPYLYAWYDFDNLVGWHFRAGASHRCPLGRSGWTAELAGSVAYELGHTQGFATGLVRTALSYDLGAGLTFGPAVDWWLPSSDADPTANGCRPVLSAGVQYTGAF